MTNEKCNMANGKWIGDFGNETITSIYPLSSQVVPQARLDLVVDPTVAFFQVHPARAEQPGGDLLRRAAAVVVVESGAGGGKLRRISVLDEGAVVDRVQRDRSALRSLSLDYVVQSGAEGHAGACGREAPARMDGRRAQLRRLDSPFSDHSLVDFGRELTWPKDRMSRFSGRSSAPAG